MRPKVVVYTEATEVGGVTKMIETLVTPLSDQFSIVIICRDGDNLKGWSRSLEKKGITVKPFALRGILDITNWFDFFNMIKVVREVRKAKLFHCHLHNPFSCSAAIMASGIFSRTRIVITEHYITQLGHVRRRKLNRMLSTLREIRIWLLLTLKKLSLHFVDRIVLVSDSNLNFMKGVFSNKIVQRSAVIHNGIEIGMRDNKVIESRNDSTMSNLLVVTVAALNNQKGHEFLLRAIPQILEKFPAARFLIIGDGHLRTFLESLAYELGIQKSIDFMGHRQDVPNILESADLFVLPSLFEGLPLALLEAMAAGKAVVATNVDGTADVVIDNETGFLVPSKNSEELARKIMVLLGEPGLRHKFGVAGRARVVNFFSDVRMANGYEQLYLELI